MIEPPQAKQAAMVIKFAVVGTLAFHILLHVLETVMLEETDAGAEIQAAKLAAEDADGMIVDQEYRLTLLELGLTDET